MPRMVNADLLIEEVKERIDHIEEMLRETAAEGEVPSYLQSPQWRRHNGSLEAWKCVLELIDDYAQDSGDMYDWAFNDGYKKGIKRGKELKEAGK